MIWFRNYTIEELENFSQKRNLMNLLDIKLVELGADFLKVSMPVTEKVHQIHGIMHGGATCVLVESVASFASSMCIDLNTQTTVGSVINVNHLRPISAGIVIATCNPVHLGRQKHVWDVVVNEHGSNRLIAKGELTCAVLEKII